MTRVTFSKSPEGLCRAVDVLGHADFADEGEDIVCAAISSAVMLTHAFLFDARRIPVDTLVEDEGAHIRLTLPDGCDRAGADALYALQLHLTELSEQYPNHIDVTEVQTHAED